MVFSQRCCKRCKKVFSGSGRFRVEPIDSNATVAGFMFSTVRDIFASLGGLAVNL